MRISVVAAGMVFFFCCACLGYQYLMNDTGQTAYGLRVVFSEPVQITGFGDGLMQASPTSASSAFLFYGGEVDAWIGGHWLTWTPSAATVQAHSWLTDPSSVEAASADWEEYLASRPFWERNPRPTFAEIMAEIAQYPGEDEPLYEPGREEAIWLTDLEGHASIYDNDSIRINYASWFDKSQVTRIEVYRNGVRMRFLTDSFDVLTNEQIKTFDGNPLEYSPASTHTDHAISGYVFTFEFLDETRPSQHRRIGRLDLTVKSRQSYDPRIAFVCLDKFWPDHLAAMTHPQRVQFFKSLRDVGFNGVSLEINDFIRWPGDMIYSQHTYDPGASPIRTPTMREVETAIRAGVHP